MVTVAEILKSGQWAVESSAPSPPQWQLPLNLANMKWQLCSNVLNQQHFCQLSRFQETEGSANLHQIHGTQHDILSDVLAAAEISTGLDTTEEEGRDRPMQKAKMEIILTKSPQFDELMAASSSQQQSSSSRPGASGSDPPGGPGGLPGTGSSSQLQVGTAPQSSHGPIFLSVTCH